VAGATSVVQQARRHPEKYPWIAKLLARKPAKVVAVAVANKTARIAWAIMSRGGSIPRRRLRLPLEGSGDEDVRNRQNAANELRG
jgi:hypothetical protein